MAADTTVIAVLGDSLVAGYGVAANEAFPVRLEQKLQQDGYAVTVLNDGISGDTTAGGVSRVESVLQQKPDMVIIELGANDMLRALPPVQTKKNLEMIMDRFKQAKVKMIITGQTAPFTLGVKYAEEYNAIFSDLAKKDDAALYPNFLEGAFGVPGLMQQDGIHPNKDGVDAMVAHFYPTVEKLLKK